MATKKIQDVTVDRIWMDADRNFRSAWKYKVEPKPDFDPEKDAPGFYEDIVLNGVRTNIEIAKLSPDQQDRIERKYGVRPDYRVIRGHRRFTAVTLARKANADLFRKLTCVVYEGLSESEEIALMYDHGGIEQLDELEVYRAIVKLFGAGHSQERVAQLIGMKRGYVQDRIYLWDLPQSVKDEYEKRFRPLADGKSPVKGKDYISFTWADVDKLHVCYNADTEDGVDPSAPESQTMVLWSSIRDRKKDSPGPNVKSMSKKDMDDRKGFIKGCEALETAHAFYNGEGGNLQEAAEQYRLLQETASEVPGLRAEVSGLKQQVKDLTVLLDERNAELSALRAVSNGVHA